MAISPGITVKFKVGDVIGNFHPFVHVLMHREREFRCEDCFDR